MGVIFYKTNGDFYMKAKHKSKDDNVDVNFILGLEICNTLIPMVYYDYMEKLGIADLAKKRVRFISRSAIKNTEITNIIEGDYTFQTTVIPPANENEKSSYIIVFDYDNVYKYTQSSLDIGPLQREFYVNILTGIIREFRRIMQLEGMVPGIKYNDTMKSFAILTNEAIDFANEFALSVIVPNISIIDEIIEGCIEHAKSNTLFLTDIEINIF